MKASILRLLILGLATWSTISSANLPRACEDALTLKTPILQHRGKIYLRMLSGIVEVEAPFRAGQEPQLTAWTFNPNGYQIATLFTYTKKEDGSAVSGSTVQVYDAFSGRLLRKAESMRTGRSIHWTDKNPDFIAMGFAEMPTQTGLFFDPSTGQGNITIGLELIGQASMELKKTIPLARNWDGFESNSNSLYALTPKYTLLFDLYGGYMAKVYSNRYDIYTVGKNYRLHFVGTYKFEQVYNPMLDLVFNLMRTPVEHFKNYVNKAVQKSRSSQNPSF